MNSKLRDTFKETADRIAFLNRFKGISSPDVQSAIEEIYTKTTKESKGIVDVRLFGMSPESTPATNRLALVNAAEYAQNTFGFVHLYIPSGEYNLYPVILSYSNMTIEGDGFTTVLHHILDPTLDPNDPIWKNPLTPTFGPTVGLLNISGGETEEEYLDNVVIRNLMVDCHHVMYDGTPSSANEGIDLEQCKNSLVDRVKVMNTNGDGIDSDFGINLTIQNCVLENCRVSGAKLSHGSRRSIIHNCYAVECGTLGSRASFATVESDPYGGGDNQFTYNIAINGGRGFSLLCDGAIAVGNQSIDNSKVDTLASDIIDVGNKWISEEEDI